jgi:hypothetical protein
LYSPSGPFNRICVGFIRFPCIIERTIVRLYHGKIDGKGKNLCGTATVLEIKTTLWPVLGILIAYTPFPKAKLIQYVLPIKGEAHRPA